LVFFFLSPSKCHLSPNRLFVLEDKAKDKLNL
jgi:hypothetical protein